MMMQPTSEFALQLHQEFKARRARMTAAALVAQRRVPDIVRYQTDRNVTKFVSRALFEQMQREIEERRAAKRAAREKAMNEALAAIMLERSQRPLTKQKIINEVAEKHRLSLGNMLSASRIACLVAARCEAAYRLRVELQMSYQQIALALGLKDHTSALHLYRSYKAKLQEAEAAE